MLVGGIFVRGVLECLKFLVLVLGWMPKLQETTPRRMTDTVADVFFYLNYRCFISFSMS